MYVNKKFIIRGPPVYRKQEAQIVQQRAAANTTPSIRAVAITATDQTFNECEIYNQKLTHTQTYTERGGGGGS